MRVHLASHLVNGKSLLSSRSFSYIVISEIQNEIQIQIPYTRVNQRFYSFIPYAGELWNSLLSFIYLLPEGVSGVSALTVIVFVRECIWWEVGKDKHIGACVSDVDCRRLHAIGLGFSLTVTLLASSLPVGGR